MILRFFDRYGQEFPKFPKQQVCNVFTISLKGSYEWISLCSSSRSKLLDYRFLMKARHAQNTRKRKFVKFFILRHSIATVFVFYCEAKTFRYLMGFQSCLLLLVFANILTVSILSGQSRFLVYCPGAPDWINLSQFLYFSPKKCSYLQNFSSAVQNHTFIVNCIYSNSYLECYKKHNSFELNKNVILKTFNLNVWGLFRETYIWFNYKQQVTYSETFFRSLFWKH